MSSQQHSDLNLVETLAQQVAYYMQISEEDTEHLGRDPAGRSAQLNARPDLKLTFNDNDDHDAYLASVNAEIVKLTPPKSLKE